jgi:prepilin-type N-terminal cleavage/methylation domain-containing protein
MKNQKKQGGFSLVELIVAIAIMAIIVLPLLRAFLVSAKTNAKAKGQLQATEAAQNVMETIEATSLDDLLTYFTSGPTDPDKLKFGESGRMRLEKDPTTGKYVTTLSTEKSAEGNYYFALQGVNDKDILLEVTANTDATDDGVVLNDQDIKKVTAISSDNDAICTFTKTAADILPDIWASYPDDIIGETSVTRNIEITIGEVTDPSIGRYTKVTTRHYYTWWGGSYPSSSTDSGFSDVVFDNSDDVSRQLNNIYLFYYPWYTSTMGNLTDNITINNTTGRDIKVFIVKQQTMKPEDMDSTQLASYQSKEASYRARINIVETLADSATTASTKLRTNFNENIYNGTSTTDPVIALNGNTWNADKISSDTLLAEGQERRLFDVTVTAYPSGAYTKHFDGITGYKPVNGGMVD